MTRVAELEQCGADERSDESTDHTADDCNRDAHHRADQPSDQRAPPGAARAAVALGESKPQPVIDDLAEKGDAEDDGDRSAAARVKTGQPAVDKDSYHHDPQPRNAERDHRQPDETQTNEQYDGEDRHAVVRTFKRCVTIARCPI